MSIVLTTLNARYAHASLGLRYLYANLHELRSQAVLQEFTIQQSVADIAEKLFSLRPRIIGIGVYIWNINESTALVAEIKALMPDVTIILGGPEVSYEYEDTAIFQQADYLVTGWGEVSFYHLCQQLWRNERPAGKVVEGIQSALDNLVLPYEFYTEEDILQRTVYVEASRGCPYKCEFCLSSLDKTAWAFPLEKVLVELDHLYDRGLRQFKFVDRTFNLKVEFTVRILSFFLAKMQLDDTGMPTLFLHFELVPDHLPEALKALILQFPKGSLQFEIGIQTLNPVVQAHISRRTHLEKAEHNIRWLAENTGVHLHVDLIAGLPSENLASFAEGFNRLYTWGAEEIQLGILKRLRGTPIIRHTTDFEYRYSPNAPYSVLSNAQMDFVTLTQIKRLARYWDLIANSGRFNHTLPLLLGDLPFERMWALTEWLYVTTGQTHALALDRLFRLLFDYLTGELLLDVSQVQAQLSQDFLRTGIQGWPRYLGEVPPEWKQRYNRATSALPKRQAQHQMI